MNTLDGRTARGGRVVAALTAALTGVALAACASGGSATEQAGAGGDDVVTFKWSENPASPSLVKIADELGYWDDASIRPEYVGQIDAGQAPALLGNGDITFAMFMTNRTLAAIASGVDIKIIASATYTTEEEPHMEYVVRKDSPITKDNLKDLEGGTIGLSSLKGCAEYILKDYLTKNGVDVTKIEWLTQAESLLPQSLESGEIDIAVIHPPLTGIVRQDPALRVAFSDYDSSGHDGGLAPISANLDFIEQHPEETKEFVGILARTANWINAHPEEQRQLVHEITGQDIEQVTKYTYVNNLLLDEEQVGFWWGLLDRVGELTPEQAALTPADIATNEFNPYAPDGGALLPSQAVNTEVLTDTSS